MVHRFFSLTCCLAVLLGATVIHAATCEALDTEATSRSTRIPGYASGRDVVGAGRLQFYSAPDRRCAIAGVFVIPGDRVTAYGEHAGYTSVMYINLKTGTDAMGWVASSRLKMNGTGIAPKQ